MREAKPHKLKDGSWGAIIRGPLPVYDEIIVVVTKDGRRIEKIVQDVLQSQGDEHIVTCSVLRPQPFSWQSTLFTIDAYDNPMQWPNHDCLGDFGHW